MATGAYDHPSYLVRQMVPLGVHTAGVGTSAKRVFPVDMRIRKVIGMVTATGTQTTFNAVVLNGTNSVGVIAFGTTAAIGMLGTSADCNSALAAGTPLQISTLLEATGVAVFTAEMHLDPGGTTGWS